MKRKLMPGIIWTFVYKGTNDTDTGILPSILGESNDFAVWVGTTWRSRKFHNLSSSRRSKGEGPQKLLGKMKSLLNDSRKVAEWRNHRPISATPQSLLEAWERQKEICVACKSSLILSDSAADHDHFSGEFRGFIHKTCNWVEGYTKKMSFEQVQNLLQWILKIKHRP